MSSTFMSAFGRAIAAQRKFVGLTQVQLGERLGWSGQNMSAIESGERVFPVGLLPELCEALDCGVTDLLRWAGERDKRALRL